MTTATPPREVKPEIIRMGESVTDYARGVVDGVIVAGHLVRMACERHLRDLETAHLRGLRFDAGKAGKAITFFGALRHYKGEWAGQPLALELWQKFIIGSLYGWVRDADGSRRFRVAYNEIPRKNGKSLMAAGVGLYLAFFDGEGGAEVYSAATKRDQAKIVWGDAKTMVKASPDLLKRIHITGGETGVGTLSRLDNASKFVPLGADGDTMDGLNIHGAIIDELHAHKTRVVWDVIQTGTGARRQPLTFVITTAGFDRFSVCYEQHEYGVKVLEEVINDDSFFVYIASWDQDDDWTDPAAWAKANPNYGISVKIDDLERKCAKAQQIPAEQNEFLRKHGNVWTEQETRWLSLEVFDANAVEVEESELKGRTCFAGLDLSTTTDLTALALYFPDPKDEGGDWMHFYFVPEDNMHERAERDRVPYEVWERQGHLTATPGNVVDYDYIREKLNALRQAGYQIKEVAYDPYNATQIITDLTGDGFLCVPIRQGFLSLSPPTKELERLLLSKKMRLGTNPVTRWAASNAVVLMDAAGNIKLDKSNPRNRIDPLAAMVDAVERASRYEGNEWHGIDLGDDEEG